MTPDPSLIVENATTLLVQWSPPFLWPGYHIDYFNVSVKQRSTNNVLMFDVLNATFDELIVSYYHVRNTSEQDASECNELLFEVSSHASSNSSHPQTYSISGAFPMGKHNIIILLCFFPSVITFLVYSSWRVSEFIIHHKHFVYINCRTTVENTNPGTKYMYIKFINWLYVYALKHMLHDPCSHQCQLAVTRNSTTHSASWT